MESNKLVYICKGKIYGLKNTKNHGQYRKIYPILKNFKKI